MARSFMQGREIVLLDGGMGQELVRRSGAAPHPLWSAKVLSDRPDIVKDLHTEFIDAGARVITINAYSATPERLARYGLEGEFQRLQRRALDLAFAARDNATAQHEVRIAGCLPPLYGSYHPEIAPAFEECLFRYEEIVRAQAADVDLFLCETMASEKEARAAVLAARASGKEVWAGLTLDDDAPARLRSGERAADAYRSVAASGASAILLNCSAPETITAELPTLIEAFPSAGAYGNGFTSIDPLELGGVVDVLEARQDLSPARYAEFAISWARAGAKIVGGCCEISPAHIHALAGALQDAGFHLSASLQLSGPAADTA